MKYRISTERFTSPGIQSAVWEFSENAGTWTRLEGDALDIPQDARERIARSLANNDREGVISDAMQWFWDSDRGNPEDGDNAEQRLIFQLRQLLHEAWKWRRITELDASQAVGQNRMEALKRWRETCDAARALAFGDEWPDEYMVRLVASQGWEMPWLIPSWEHEQKQRAKKKRRSTEAE